MPREARQITPREARQLQITPRVPDLVLDVCPLGVDGSPPRRLLASSATLPP